MLKSLLTLFLTLIFALTLSWGEPLVALAQAGSEPQSTLPETTQAEQSLPEQASLADWAEQINDLINQAFAATNTGDFAIAEENWTKLIEILPNNPAFLSNRGNVRVSQNKLEAAIADYNQAIELAPDAPDPYLNRGTALEGLERWEEAIADYNHVLELSPDDPAAYNNRGNANAGLGQWEAALEDYHHAADLVPDYAFAHANYALALYQTGDTEAAIRKIQSLVRKYPRFADMRAALTAALWASGQRGEAESNWVAAAGLDSRYKNLDWVAHDRRWPPKMVEALGQFLEIR